MSEGPDDYTEATANELGEADMELLSDLWPAAFVAVGKLWVAIEDGNEPSNSPLLDLNLYDLVSQHG